MNEATPQTLCFVDDLKAQCKQSGAQFVSSADSTPSNQRLCFNTLR